MTYAMAVDYLYGLQMFGIKMGLDNIRRLCRELGDPQEKFDTIHIAGTNGKGSTCALIESVLRSAGITTGLYTSPHLVDFTERIQVCGQPISAEAVVAFTARIRPLADELKATFFEATTAMAFAHFAAQDVRIAVIETGLGGRLDATNVISPLVSVITPIALDHVEHLGRTLVQIAQEKAGIFKPYTPTVIAAMDEEPRQALLRAARKLECPVIDAAPRLPVQIKRQSPLGLDLDFQFGCQQISITVPLPGRHQATNAATAMATLRELSEQGFRIPMDALVAGLGSVRWPGRFQVVNGKCPMVLDVAHNPAGAAVLADTVKACFPALRPVFVLGIMADKNYPEFLRVLCTMNGRFVLCRPNVARAADPADLAASMQTPKVELADRVSAAVDGALQSAAADEVVVVTGSFHTVGEAMEHLGLVPFPAK